MEQALYLTEPGDSAAISTSDIHQEQIGDCGLLSVLGEIALKDPSYISSHLIAQNADGTENVALHNDARGGDVGFWTSQFSAVSFNVSNDFPAGSVNSYPTDSVAGGVKEIWPQVLESAYAEDQGGYGAISNGVYDMLAMETFTGNHASWESPADKSLAQLRHQLRGFANSADALVTFDTPASSTALPYNLVEDHAYMFDGVEMKHGHMYVALLNPWGTDEPKLVPAHAIAANFDQINFGKV